MDRCRAYYFGYDNKNVTKPCTTRVLPATSDKERDAKYLAAAAKLVSEDAPADWLFNWTASPPPTAKGVEGFPLRTSTRPFCPSDRRDLHEVVSEPIGQAQHMSDPVARPTVDGSFGR